MCIQLVPGGYGWLRLVTFGVRLVPFICVQVFTFGYGWLRVSPPDHLCLPYITGHHRTSIQPSSNRQLRKQDCQAIYSLLGISDKKSPKRSHEPNRAKVKTRLLGFFTIVTTQYRCQSEQLCCIVQALGQGISRLCQHYGNPGIRCTEQLSFLPGRKSA